MLIASCLVNTTYLSPVGDLHTISQNDRVPPLVDSCVFYCGRPFNLLYSGSIGHTWGLLHVSWVPVSVEKERQQRKTVIIIIITCVRQ